MSDEKVDKEEEDKEIIEDDYSCHMIIQVYVGYNSPKATNGYPLLQRVRQAVDKVLAEESKKDKIEYEILRWKDDNFKLVDGFEEE